MTYDLKKKNIALPLLLFAGMLLVLVPIFTFMTLERLKRQDEFITQKMFERGMALIRTFEAGTRTGMVTMRWGARRIQTLLEETAAQPEVAYIQIVDANQKILAHSQTGEVGEQFLDMPDMIQEDGPHFTFGQRVRYQDGEPYVLEVYKRFVPVHRPAWHKGRKRHRDPMTSMNHPDPAHAARQAADKTSRKDWIRNHMESLPLHYIFVGVSMEKAQELKGKLYWETVIRSVFLFLLCAAGVMALLAFQAYRSTKASLTRVTAFSNEVIENMPSGLMTLDAQGRVTSMNQAAKTIVGKDLKAPDPGWMDLIEQVRAGHPVITREMTLEKGAVKPVRLEVTASQTLSGEDSETGFLLLFRDLSQIKDLQQQVETHRRLAAIGKLAGGVAHEIRNPLSSIKGFATYFATRYKDNEADYNTARIMEGEVERINRSITQLLEFAKPMAVTVKEVDIRELIDHSLALVAQDLKDKEIRARVDIQTLKSTVATDPDRMNQVLLNLYINAVQALDPGGALEVTVTDGPDENGIEIRVADTGPGMDPATADRIFDPYFTTKPTGTGLGLSIVHRIIDNLGGQIHVESRVGKGTVFTISLNPEKRLRSNGSDAKGKNRDDIS